MSFFILGARCRWVVNSTPLLLYPRGKIPISVLQGTGWAPGLVWTGVESLAAPGFDPGTVQLVAICYTDLAMPTNILHHIQLVAICYNTELRRPTSSIIYSS